MRERDLFIEALERSNPVERASLLDEACRHDIELRARVERLLAEHERQESFILDAPPVGLDITDEPAISERPGAAIGPYKLLQQIGEGGMGVVFMAEQTEPIQRSVALKIIKPGMDTRQVIARFEAERQALAMMDHPNIAKVLDAGTTGTGRPYFVMELVKGVPITKYCDEKQLSIRQRLELFKPVCEAVQHAHQKGIIHRDLKPTNVLVAEYDNRPVPKVIDFGVAKATAQKLTERTMFTEFGQLIGTVEYMSPEQAKFNQLDIDTRSDIYSLGVLLYELLTGSTPFDRERLRSAAFDEVLRIIREEEPPKPSTRLTTSGSLRLEGRSREGESLVSIAANRNSEPARLSKDVQGELDWIVMKCLEKDRNRRYETANGLAVDMQRYLHAEAVHACPPSTWYRARKFLQRNKATATTAFIVAASLLLGTGVSVWQAEVARRAEALAEARLQAESLARKRADDETAKAVAVSKLLHTMLLAIQDAQDNPAGLKSLLGPVATTYREVIKLRPDDAMAHLNLSVALGKEGRFDEAIEVNKESIRLKPDYAEAHFGLGWLFHKQGQLGDAVDSYRRAIELDSSNYKFFNNLSWVLLDKQNYSEAEEVARKSLELTNSPEAFFNLGSALRGQAKYEESLDAYQEALKLGPDDSVTVSHLAGAFVLLGRFDEAVVAFRKAIKLGANSADVYSNLGSSLNQLKKYDEAVGAFRKAIDIEPKFSHAHAGLGVALGSLRQFDEADVAWTKAIELAHEDAPLLNHWAWKLTTDPDPQHGDRERAVAMAESAVDLAPNDGEVWNTLGVALYRTEKWQRSIDALKKSMALRDGGDASDWLFMAMADWQLDKKEDATKWYRKSVDWLDKNQPKNEELLRFRVEAAELLGIAKPTAPQPSTLNPQPSTLNPKP